MGNLIRQPLLVNGPYLLEQDNRIPLHSVGFRFDFDVSRQLRFLDLRRNGRYNDRWTEAIANIVLDNQDGAHSTLLRTYDRRQIRIENIPAFHNQSLHPAYEATEYTFCILFSVKRL